MAEDLQRADRIKRLKIERRLKWREVADALGVSERAVMEWAKKGTCSEEHCDALAAYLEVDPGWLWKGPKPESPDLMGALSGGVQTQLDQMEALLRDSHQMTKALLGFATERAIAETPPPKKKPDDESGPTAGESGPKG